jgi:glycosyltransferase involved in cell wall biosynthesis
MPNEEILELTILMPCLNEAETLETCIRKAQQSIRDLNVTGEVIISDNGSTDGSQQIALGNGARVIDIEQRGYGAALIGGIAAAKSKYVIMGDADDSYDFSDLCKFLEKLRLGSDLVMGNRFKGGISKGAMPPLHKYLGNPVLSMIGRILFKVKIGDFHCGLRGFNLQSIRGLGLSTTGMEFASEMVVKASIAELKIDEVPTTLAKDGRSRSPHLRTWADGWRHLKFMLALSPRWVFLYTGRTLVATGTAVVVALVAGSLSIGGVTFDIQTLILFSALIPIGFQSILFWEISKKINVDQMNELRPESQDQDLRNNANSFLTLGAIVLLVSIITILTQIALWGSSGFADINSRIQLGATIVSSVFLILGFQLLLNGLILNVIEVERKPVSYKNVELKK